MENERISEHIRTFVRMRPEVEVADDNASQENFYLTGSGQESGSAISEYDKTGNCRYFSTTLKRDYQFKVDGFFDGSTKQDEVRSLSLCLSVCLSVSPAEGLSLTL
jgi:hypothetical protein